MRPHDYDAHAAWRAAATASAVAATDCGTSQRQRAASEAWGGGGESAAGAGQSGIAGARRREESIADPAEILLSDAASEPQTFAAAATAASTAALAAISGTRGRGIDNRPAWMIAASASAASLSASSSSSSFSSSSSSSSHLPPPLRPPPAPFAALVDAPESESGGIGSGGGSGIGSGGSGGGGGSKRDLALRMMQKWGFEEGGGLGRHGAGIRAPLVHVRTGRNKGIIRQAAVAVLGSESAVSAAAAAATAPFLYASPLARAAAAAPALPAALLPEPEPASGRVLLLRNVCSSADVDDDLEGEIGDECARLCGCASRVEAVLVFVCAPGSVADAEAVRVFVVLSEPEFAAACRASFEGRFFGGRRVRAALFDEERYRRLDLAPQLAR